MQKPNWPQGLRLMPQHFQAQDRYHEERLALTLRLVLDRPWGVAELEVDSDAVDSGELVLRQLRGILPDGTPILVGRGGSDAISRSFEPALRGRSTLDVFVGVIRDVPGRDPAAVSNGAPNARRYTSETSVMAEYDSGQNPVAVPWARPNVKILFEGEPLESYSLLRVARVKRSESGRPVLDPQFVPPVLRMKASPVLEQIVRSLDKSMRAARAALTEQRSDGEVTFPDAVRLLLAMMLGRMIPRVSDILATSAHPREAYRLLSELVGALSPLTPAGVATIPPFDYLELGGTFETLATQAREVLDAVLAPSYRAMNLRRYDDNTWFVELREPAIFGKEFLLVVVGADPAAIRTHFPRLAKLGAWDDLGSLVHSALPGVGLLAESRRPTGLAVPPHAVCFRVDKQSPDWASVTHKGTLGLYTPPPLNQAQVMLFVKEPGVLR